MASEKEEFKLTTEEADRLKDALKKEEFRKLLMEYAQEISDPENKRKYEEDILQLEKERGMDVKFVNLKPKFVLKTSLLPDKKKLFINVGTSDHVGTPQAIYSTLPNGKKGNRWSIPYTITPPRDDLHNGKKCSILDVGFHSDTMNQAEKDHRFTDLITNTAIEGVQKDLGLQIDKKRVKKMKFEYKGVPKPSLIRKKKEGGSPMGSNEGQNDPGPFKFPYPPLHDESVKDVSKPNTKQTVKPPNEPMYTVIHRGEFDMQDYTYSQISNTVRRPKELVVSIILPQLDSARTLELDIFEKNLVLSNENPLYHLNVNFSYSVDDDRSKAQFDKSTHTLIVTLPVLPPPATPQLPHPHNDNRNPLIELIDDDNTDTIVEYSPDVTMATEPSPINPCVRSDWSVNEVWVCPSYSYRQNEDCISFVVHVTKIKMNTLISHFSDDSAQVTFVGAETDQSEFKSYSIYIQLDGCDPVINSGDCHVNVGAENTVIVIGKKSSVEIQKFKIGANPSNLTEKLFLTDDNVSDIIHRVTDEKDPWDNTGSPSLSVELNRQDEHECVLDVIKEATPLTNGVTMETTTETHKVHNITPPTNGNGLSPHEDSVINRTTPTSDNQTTPTPFNTNEMNIKGLVKLSNDLLYDLD